MSKMPPPEGYDDNPEWTDETTARARSATDVLTPAAAGALRKRGRGRPPGSDKENITLRIDKAALDRFRAGGPGWQTRINEAVRKAAGL